jgi:hypothetical protein
VAALGRCICRGVAALGSVCSVCSRLLAALDQALSQVVTVRTTVSLSFRCGVLVCCIVLAVSSLKSDPDNCYDYLP